MTIQIYDILKSEEWKTRVLNSIPEILESGHHNAENYRDLEKRLPDYECFNAIVEDEKLVAISGLYNGGIYPNNTARILDRTYYYNWNKDEGTKSVFRSDTRYNSFYAIPYQIAVAKEKGFSSVFISMQTPSKRRALSWLIKNQPTYNFELLDGLYNTCKCLKNGTISPNPLCWQNVALHYLTDDTEFALPRITIEEYYERYKDVKSIR